MKTFLCFVIVALVAAAGQALAAICQVSDPDSIDPPPGSVMVATALVDGDRIWQCNNGTIVDPNLQKGEAQGYGPGWLGGFFYSNSTPPQSNTYFNSTTNPNDNILMLLSTTPTVIPQEGKLPYALWQVDTFLDPPAYFPKGSVAYLTRTNTTGGVTPTECPDPEATEIDVPFTGNLTLYVCTGGDISGAGGVGIMAATVFTLGLLLMV